MLETQSEVTLYQQIYDDIKHKIGTGEYREGQALPSEAKLCEIYGVSRVTVRAAIAELAEDDLVVKKHGKGTFVKRKKMDSSLFRFEGFTTACKRNNVEISTHVLQLEEQKPTARDIQLLKLSPDDTVIYLNRLRSAGGIPVIIEHVRLSKKKYGFLLDCDLENKSLYATLAEHTGANPEDYCNVNVILEAGAATPEEARLLDIKKGMPLFVLRETVASSDTGEPVHWTKQLMSGSYFQFTLSNDQSKLGLNLG